ncbi:MAG TPA: winged helix-turn-helix domain-containing protein [Casimicrobiaceae bacterium]|nr:winged helix-turn-helix domain-containing protein [Casimicrobiaceae bacterium]
MDGRATESTSSYRSGAIEIDAMHRQVLIDGTPARIGARAFDVLLALVERRDRVVSKHELMDIVWRNLVVEENNLLVHMVALRKLLGPRAIATIPGRGYRFVMPIEVIDTRVDGDWSPASQTVRGNLPASPALFGRAQDLEAVDLLLREHSVVSIVGAAGIGKTSLALAAAAAAGFESQDGRWWVELAPINEGSQIASTIGGALGIQTPAGRPPQEAIAWALANRHLLIVLDNCEHLAEDVASLIDGLRARAPNVRLLVTSQESLKCRDEQVYRLGALAIPVSARLEDAADFGAVALFVERAHAVDARFRLADDNVAIVVDICRRLDGIPLAIELAAARVPLLGVHGLHARLNQIFNVLSGGMRMKLRRHQTLRAALQWSHDLLSADEQTVFRRLGVFAGGFGLDLAQSVVSDAAIDQWLVLDLLGHLVDKSLVIADAGSEPRYRLLETTRAFALEQLAASGDSEAMLRRHAQAMCQLMVTIEAAWWDSSPAEHRSAVQELGNLRAALDWAQAATDEPALVYQLLGKCWPVWLLNGLSGEGAQRMLRLLPVPSSLSTEIEADFCLGFARLTKGAGRAEHWEAARRAEALYRQLDDADRLGHALLLVATIGALRDQMPSAARALHEAEKLVTDDSPLRKQASLAATQGHCHLRRGEAELAIAAFRRQVELNRLAGDALGENVALGNVGSAQLDAGDLDGAIETVRRSVEGLRKINAPYGLEFRLSTLAVALAWRGDDADIVPLAREAFDHHRLLGVTFAPLMAAALQHARRDDAQRAVLISGYACTKLPQREPQGMIALPMQQRVLERAAMEHSRDAIETWLRAGERLNEDQAAAIAFDTAPIQGLI